MDLDKAMQENLLTLECTKATRSFVGIGIEPEVKRGSTVGAGGPLNLTYLTMFNVKLVRRGTAFDLVMQHCKISSPLTLVVCQLTAWLNLGELSARTIMWVSAIFRNLASF